MSTEKVETSETEVKELPDGGAEVVTEIVVVETTVIDPPAETVAEAIEPVAEIVIEETPKEPEPWQLLNLQILALTQTVESQTTLIQSLTETVQAQQTQLLSLAESVAVPASQTEALPLPQETPTQEIQEVPKEREKPKKKAPPESKTRRWL